MRSALWLKVIFSQFEVQQCYFQVIEALLILAVGVCILVVQKLIFTIPPRGINNVT